MNGRRVLRNAALLVGIFILLTALGEHAAVPALILVILLLMVFPGPDPERPRLVRLLPWYLGLDWLAAAVIAGARLAGRELVPGEMNPETWQLVMTLLSHPVLIWALVRRHPSFRAVLVVWTLASLGGGTYDYLESSRSAGELWQWLVLSALGLAVSAYLWLKVQRPCS